MVASGPFYGADGFAVQCSGVYPPSNMCERVCYGSGWVEVCDCSSHGALYVRASFF